MRPIWYTERVHIAIFPTDMEAFSKVASIEEILKNDGSLRVSRYVRKVSDEGLKENEEDFVENWLTASKKAHDACQEIIKMLEEGER